MEQKKLGHFQIEIGYVIIALSVFLWVLCNYVLFSRFIIGFSGITTSWKDFATELAIDEPLRQIVGPQLIDFSIVLSFIFVVGELLFSLICVLFVLVGVLFITQGTANKNMGKLSEKIVKIPVENNLSTKVFFVTYIFTSAISLLFFIPLWGDVTDPNSIGLSFGLPLTYVDYNVQSGYFSYFSFFGLLVDVALPIILAVGARFIYSKFIFRNN